MAEQTGNTPWQIRTWHDAELTAAAFMRQIGFTDARLTQSGADGGIDVFSSAAVAQVKFQAAAQGRKALQEFYGASAAPFPNHTRLFFTGTSFTKTAVQYADLYNICLFTYGIDGTFSPANRWALSLLAELEELRDRAKKEASAKSAVGRDAARTSAPKRQEKPGEEHDGCCLFIAITMFVLVVFGFLVYYGT